MRCAPSPRCRRQGPTSTGATRSSATDRCSMRCASLAEELGIADRVRVPRRAAAQPRSRTSSPARMSSCLPSVTAADGDVEGVPVALMEAMAAGLIAVSTYHSGIPELVENQPDRLSCAGEGRRRARRASDLDRRQPCCRPRRSRWRPAAYRNGVQQRHPERPPGRKRSRPSCADEDRRHERAGAIRQGGAARQPRHRRLASREDRPAVPVGHRPGAAAGAGGFRSRRGRRADRCFRGAVPESRAAAGGRPAPRHHRRSSSTGCSG